jgi:hypothetical protein
MVFRRALSIAHNQGQPLKLSKRASSKYVVHLPADRGKQRAVYSYQWLSGVPLHDEMRSPPPFKENELNIRSLYAVRLLRLPHIT